MDNKELRVQAQNYIEDNGITKNTNQIEKAFIDGALMMKNQAKKNEVLDIVSKSFYSDDAIVRLKAEYFEKGLKANK